jgi:hypothetical protein
VSCQRDFSLKILVPGQEHRVLPVKRVGYRVDNILKRNKETQIASTKSENGVIAHLAENGARIEKHIE